MDTAIRFVGMFLGVFVGNVIAEYVILRIHESDEPTVAPDSLAEVSGE